MNLRGKTDYLQLVVGKLKYTINLFGNRDMIVSLVGTIGHALRRLLISSILIRASNNTIKASNNG